MSRLLILIFALLLSFQAFAQQPKYSKIRIQDGVTHIKALYGAGVAMDHVEQEKNALIGFFSEDELRRIKSVGCTYDVLIDDMLADFLATNTQPSFSGRPCASPADTIKTPKDFKLGKMGGYFTLSDLQGHLDNMAAKYPKLITKRAPIGTFKTQENRVLEFVKISDNPNTNERATEKQVLYTALIHAREPMGLSQLVFFMYYLLENYEKDRLVKHIVDNFELVFAPCLNPDGYVYNETIAPSGGGMWRKNRRPIGRNVGVDLNRNFGAGWGGEGSSEDPSSDIYRGSGAFSEPETQAYKWFIEQHEFKFVLNYHTFSNLLLFPYGYTDSQCKDHASFLRVSKIMVDVCGYTNQPANALYLASGVTDDWLYDQMGIMGMTPEVGEAFWLTSDAIEPTCKKLVWKNLAMPLMVDGYTRFEHNFSANELGEGKTDLPFSITPAGFKASSRVKVSLTSPNKNVVCGAPVEWNGLENFVSVAGQISVEILNTAKENEVIPLVFTVTDGITNFSYKATKIYTPKFENQTIFLDQFNDTKYWALSEQWGLSNTQSVSAPSSLTDSPSGSYRKRSSASITLRNSINLSTYKNAYLSFKIKYDIDKTDLGDYFQVIVSNGDDCYKILNGNHSTGNETFDKGYIGKQDSWLLQTVDISEFTGGLTNIVLYFNSDLDNQADGVYIDDLEVFTRVPKGTDPGPTAVRDAELETQLKLYPNPVTDKLFLSAPDLGKESVSIRILNTLGQELKRITHQSSETGVILDVSELPKGVYMLDINIGNRLASKRFVKE
ncbi:MAG: T9SS C-terminal target domain-containing protein [Cytophagales bacterium]|nr:MAG: T9SS C-terminal target domain-containing protein [Cytophagales bacterium]TAF61099.1 MAG: T9SS C-terminal target domain-containing protein [Cytophagales bacterium]